VKQAVTSTGAKVKLITARIGDVKLADDSLLKIDDQLAGTPSVMFDAIALDTLDSFIATANTRQ